MGIANDIASLDATAQAELVRNGSVSADELVEAAIEAAQAREPADQRDHPPAISRQPQTRQPQPSRAVRRRADGGQRPRLHDEGRAVSPRVAGPEVGRLPRPRRLRVVPQVPRSRVRGHRSNQRSGDGKHHHDRAVGVRAVTQSMEPRPLHRRVVGRVRRRGRGGHRRRRARQRRWRFDSRARVGMRAGRPEAEQGSASARLR